MEINMEKKHVKKSKRRRLTTMLQTFGLRCFLCCNRREKKGGIEVESKQHLVESLNVGNVKYPRYITIGEVMSSKHRTLNAKEHN
jgi:hypothetical protein